jgi:hypothetical protein
MATIQDMIDAIATDKPVDAQAAFDEIIGEKITSRLDDMRVQVAQNMFAPTAQEETAEE